MQFQNYAAIPEMVDNVKKLETDYKQLQFPRQESVGKSFYAFLTRRGGGEEWGERGLFKAEGERRLFMGRGMVYHNRFVHLSHFLFSTC